MNLFITKCVRFYYKEKELQLIQNHTVIQKSNTTIPTKKLQFNYNVGCFLESKTVLANYIIFVQQALLRIHYTCITFLSILLILIKVFLKKYMRGDPAGAQLVVEEGRPTLLFLKIRKVS